MANLSMKFNNKKCLKKIKNKIKNIIKSNSQMAILIRYQKMKTNCSLLASDFFILNFNLFYAYFIFLYISDNFNKPALNLYIQNQYKKII